MPQTLDERAQLAQSDNQELERLVQDYQPFILGCVYNRGFGERDEQISIALGAFCEAVQSYSRAKGSFLPYAGKVIQSRLIDGQRRLSRYLRRNVAMEDVGVVIDARFAARQQSIIDHRELCRNEIAEFTAELSAWGISLDEVAAAAPRHALTKSICRRALSSMVEDDRMAGQIRTTRKLPLKDLSLLLGVGIKVLERYRRYLIAAWLIRQGDYAVLKEYVPYCGEGEDSQ